MPDNGVRVGMIYCPLSLTTSLTQIFLECYFWVHVSVSDSPQTFPDCRCGFRQQTETSVVVDSSQRLSSSVPPQCEIKLCLPGDCSLGVYWWVVDSYLVVSMLIAIFQQPRIRDWYARQPSMCLTEGIFSLETVFDLCVKRECIAILLITLSICSFKTPTVVNLTAYTVCGLFCSVTHRTICLQKISFLPLAATQAGADSMMAISLCFVLFNHRTGFRRSASIPTLCEFLK